MINFRRENAQLKVQIDEWKGKLIVAEKAAGINPIVVSESSGKTEVAETPIKEKSSVANNKQEKKEKPKKEKKPTAAVGGDGDGGIDVGR